TGVQTCALPISHFRCKGGRAACPRNLSRAAITAQGSTKYRLQWIRSFSRGGYSPRSIQLEGGLMLYWTLMFLVIAVIAGVLGFTGVAVAAAGVAKLLFFVFLVLFVISLFSHLSRRGTSV